MSPPVLRTAAPGLHAGERAAVLVVLVRPDPDPQVGEPLLPVGIGALLSDAAAPDEPVLRAHLARAGSPLRAGGQLDVALVDGPLRSVLLVGRGDGAPGSLRRAGAAIGRTLRTSPAAGTVVIAGLEHDSPEGVRAFAEGLTLAAYSFALSGTDAVAADVLLLVPESRVEAVRRAQVAARAVYLARDLANTPSSTKSPAWLADRAVELAPRGVRVRVVDEVELAAQGFGGILAVGMGSVRPPRLVELTYTPAHSRGERLPHVVLVGKGITFDTGGISLKTTDGMIAMKTDMAGAGAVLAVVSALPELDVRARVTGLLCCAENMPSGTAMRPSDVIAHYGGRTVEVLNTDAEGRLVLADGLAYADARLDPDAVVDIATLTGAVGVALGKRDAALYANDDRLARSLEAASVVSGERVWRMPLVEDYRSAIDSDVADLTNVPVKPTRFGGGSIVAGLFLQEFAGDRAWAHLDIAGTGRADADADELTKGATGYGVRLLLRYLEAL